MKNIAVFVFVLFCGIANAQKFTFEKVNRAWSLGTLGGIAEGLARRTSDTRAIQVHQSVDFSATSLNLVLIGAGFSGWKEKTKKQRRQTVVNAVLYTAIGLGSRSLAIKYSTQIGKR